MDYEVGTEITYIDPKTGEEKTARKPSESREMHEKQIRSARVALWFGGIFLALGLVIFAFANSTGGEDISWIFLLMFGGVGGITFLFGLPLPSLKKSYGEWDNWEIAVQCYEEHLRLQARLKKMREEELAIDEANQKYASYFGQDKKIHIARDLKYYYNKISAEAQKASFQAINDAYADYNGLREKEKNWAIRAGVADGLAGGVAGLATALQVQAENERIRDRNKQLIGDLGNLARAKASLHQLREADADAMSDYWREKGYRCRRLSYESMDPEELLKKLSPTVIDTEIREETRAIKLKVKTRSIRHLMLTKGVTGTVDGGFIAEIWFKNKKIGSAYATLPFDGAESALTMDCVCINVDKQITLPNDPKQLKITFVPNKLWAVEIKDDED